MSSITFHKIALPPILNGLKNAHAFITKGYEHTKAKSIDPNDFLAASIHPDMKDFRYQVYRFTDAAKFIPSRVNPSTEGISLPDTEQTFPELLERIQKTITYLESVDAKSFEGREQETVTIPIGKGVDFTAAEYVAHFAHPNFWYVDECTVVAFD